MSLFAALTVAVGGLDAQSRSIGNISDNISNASTVGFKRIDTNFQSLVTQSNSRINDPGGVRATPDYQNNVQGNLIQSQNPTALAISGNGFFDVRKPSVDSSGSTTFGSEDFFTRVGDFSVNKDGYLVNGAGYALTGFSVDTSGSVDSSTWDPIQVSQLVDKPVATNGVSYSANLPASGVFSQTFPEATVQIYDALGAQHALKLKWTKGASGDPANTWYLDVTPDDAVASAAFVNNAGTTVALGDSLGTQRLTFTFGTTTSSTETAGTINALANQGSGTLFNVVTPSAPDNFANVSFDLTFVKAGAQTITMKFGAYDTPSGVTQFDASDINVSSFEQNGIPRGSFRDLSIDSSGFVFLNYDNGRSRTIAQIPIVQFNNPNGLQRVDGGAYSRTNESGEPRRNPPGNSGAGAVVSNTLEGSNVDIADEFTKMIQAQRVYSANARTITTANNMLEEVINIVR
jgi:flagellar hook protein FlgE